MIWVIPAHRQLAVAYESNTWTSSNNKNRNLIVFAGKKGLEFDQVSDPAFDQSGRHCVYLAGMGSKVFLIHNDKPRLLFDFGNSEVFWEILLDRATTQCRFKAKGQEEALASVVWPPVFAADSSSAFIGLLETAGNTVKVIRATLFLDQKN